MQTTPQDYEIVTAKQHKTRLRDLIPALLKPGFNAKVEAVLRVYQHHRIGRAINRYLQQGGRLTAGGISYLAIFSLAAALTVVWTVFARFFAKDPNFQSSVVEAINSFLPGLLREPGATSGGLLNPETVQVGSGNTITAIIAFLVALWAASRVVRYLVAGIRSMFGLLNYPGNFIATYTRYFLGLALLLIAVLVSAALSLVSTWLEKWVNEFLLAWSGRDVNWIIDLAAVLIPLLIDFFVFAVMVRFVADIRVPYRHLLRGAFAFAVASSLLRYAGGAVIHGFGNPLVAAAATLVTLLIWVNVLSRVALIISAWVADPPAIPLKVTADEVHAKESPNYVTLGSEHTLDWPHHPFTGDLIPARKVSEPDTAPDLEPEPASKATS